MIYSKLIAGRLRNLADQLEREYQDHIESDPDDRKIDFRKKLILWYGLKGHIPLSLDMVKHVRMQGEFICLRLEGDDQNDEYEYAIKIGDLINNIIREGHEDEEIDETIESLSKSLKKLEAHKKGRRK